MKLQIPVPEKTQRTLAPEGNHVARCISFIDFGTQEGEWKGEPIFYRKAQITWELPNEKHVFNEEIGEQPFVVSKEYTLSFSEKAAFKKDLESWMGAFTEEKLENFTEKDILEKECMINVTHKVSASGNNYCKVTSVTPIPKGMKCPDQINKTKYFFMGVGENEVDYKVLDNLPDWMKEKITSSPEYQRANASDTSDGKENLAKNLPF